MRSEREVSAFMPGSAAAWGLPPSLLFFTVGMLLEAVLDRFALYRVLRHLARAAVMGFAVHVIAFQFNGTGRFDPKTPVLDRITLPHAAAVVIAVVFGFVLSIRQDTEAGSARASASVSGSAVPAERPVNRFRKTSAPLHHLESRL